MPRPFGLATAPTTQSAQHLVMTQYNKREETRQKKEMMSKKARDMLFDPDFEERLKLFMSDVLHLDGQRLDHLPHEFTTYFKEEEMVKLDQFECLLDTTKTAHQILESFEEIFPTAQKDSTLLQWIRNKKECIRGTLEGIVAKEILQSRLEAKAEAEAEREKEEREEAKKHMIAQKRKETNMKRKRERNADGAEQNGESEESTSEEHLRTSASDNDSPDARPANKRRKTKRPN
jgi:hypothetical protein